MPKKWALSILAAPLIFCLTLVLLPGQLQIIPATIGLVLHTDAFVSEHQMSEQFEGTQPFYDALRAHANQLGNGGSRTSTQTARVDLSIYGVPYFWDDWRIHFETRCKDKGGGYLFTDWSRRIDVNMNDQTNTFLAGQCSTPLCNGMIATARRVGQLQSRGLLHTYSIELGGTYLHQPNPQGKAPHEVGVRCDP